jgi:hypothetical protein
MTAYEQAVYRDEMFAYSYQYKYTGKPFINQTGYIRAKALLEHSKSETYIKTYGNKFQIFTTFIILDFFVLPREKRIIRK